MIKNLSSLISKPQVIYTPASISSSGDVVSSVFEVPNSEYLTITHFVGALSTNTTVKLKKIEYASNIGFTQNVIAYDLTSYSHIFLKIDQGSSDDALVQSTLNTASTAKTFDIFNQTDINTNVYVRFTWTIAGGTPNLVFGAVLHHDIKNTQNR